LATLKFPIFQSSSLQSSGNEYRSGKAKGWGALAKSLGIKPGSKEFHALKNGHDLHDDKDRGEEKDKGKGKDKDKGKKQK